MKTAKEILSDIVYDDSGHSKDELLDKALEVFELKRKKLQVRIFPSAIRPVYYIVPFRFTGNGLSEKMFEKKQKAIEFCTRHGLEIIEMGGCR